MLQESILPGSFKLEVNLEMDFMEDSDPDTFLAYKCLLKMMLKTKRGQARGQKSVANLESVADLGVANLERALYNALFESRFQAGLDSKDEIFKFLPTRLGWSRQIFDFFICKLKSLF